MPAATAAAVAAPQMVGRRKDHHPVFKIKIAGQDFPGSPAALAGTVKLHHAGAAEAGLVLQVSRHLREQGIGNFHFGAPARAFVSGGRAKLAVIGLAAQRALSGLRFGRR